MTRLLRLLYRISWLFVCCGASARAAGTDDPWIYYADNNRSVISRLKVDAPPPQVIATTAPFALGLEIDHIARRVYWSNGGPGGTIGGSITRADLDGSHSELFYAPLSGTQESVGGFTIDETNRQIYWIDGVGRRILRRAIDGGPVHVVLQSSTAFGSAIEVDPMHGHLYFTSGGKINGVIERVNLDGSDRQPIADAYGYSLALDLVRERIYIADWDQHRIRRVDFDGRNLVTLGSRVTAPRDVQVVGDELYFPDIYSVAANQTGPYFFEWIRSDLDGLNREVLYDVPRSEGPIDMIQFSVFVPEPNSTFHVATATTILLLRRVRRELRTGPARRTIWNLGQRR